MKTLICFLALCAFIRTLGYLFGDQLAWIFGLTRDQEVLIHWGIIATVILLASLHMVATMVSREYGGKLVMRFMALSLSILFSEFFVAIVDKSPDTSLFGISVLILFGGFAYALFIEKEHTKKSLWSL